MTAEQHRSVRFVEMLLRLPFGTPKRSLLLDPDVHPAVGLGIVVRDGLMVLVVDPETFATAMGSLMQGQPWAPTCARVGANLRAHPGFIGRLEGPELRGSEWIGVLLGTTGAGVNT